MCVKVAAKMRVVLVFLALLLGLGQVQARPKRSACKAILAEVEDGRWKDMPHDIIKECRQTLQSTRDQMAGDEGILEYVKEPRSDVENVDYIKTTRKFIRHMINALSGLSLNLKHMKATQRQADHGKTWKP